MDTQETSSPCTPQRVRALCAELGFFFSENVCAGLSSYLLLLAKWNRVMNLVGPAQWEDMLARLVADSFYLADFLPSLGLPEAPECWDLGSGAGLPGVPLRMLWQKGRYSLVEAREKRALFLRTVLAACPLPGVTVFRGRAETFMPLRPPADLVVSRAFMPWEKTLALAEPYIAEKGFCVFLALEPIPGSLPGNWTAAAVTRYTLAGTARFFWALRKT